MKREEQMVFSVSYEGQGDGVPVVIIGMPAQAWEYMKDGKTHHFDFTNIGVPVKLMMFGAESHDAAMAVLAQATDVTVDMRGADFWPKGE